MNKVLHSSERHDWPTPGYVRAILDAFAPKRFDPCEVEVDDKGNLHLTEDGLSRSWRTGLPVYVNPPYGKALKHWIAKAAAEAALGAEVLLLVPARPADAWHEHIFPKAAAICWWRKRIVFEGAKAGAPFPSALIYWGPRWGRFADTFDAHGSVVKL